MTDKEFNIQDYLTTQIDRMLFLKECIKQDTGDGSLIAAALKDVVEAAGTAEIAEKIGMKERNLGKVLSNSTSLPFITTLKIMQVFGIQLKAKKLKEVKSQKAEKKSNQKAEKKSDQKVEKKSDQKVEKKSDQKVEKKSDQKVEKKSDQKVEKKSDQKVEKKSDQKVEKK